MQVFCSGARGAANASCRPLPSDLNVQLYATIFTFPLVAPRRVLPLHSRPGVHIAIPTAEAA